MPYADKGNRWIIYALLLLTAVLGVRLLLFIRVHSVNLLFSDQWVYLAPLFDQQSAWQLFSQQHGPHRQGLGLLITAVLLKNTNWNVTVDSQFMALYLLFAAILAMAVVMITRGRPSLSDLLLPLLFLSPIHYETILLAPNSSHSIVPLALITASLLGILHLQRPLGRWYLLIVGFLLLFTGFGFFAGLLLLVGLVAQWLVRVARGGAFLSSLGWQNSLLALCALLSIYLFFHDYRFAYAAYDFSTEAPTGWQHLKFFLFFWAGIFQIRGGAAILVGGSFLLLLIAVLGYSTLRAWRRQEKEYLLVVFVLLQVMLYATALSVGRVETGAEFAQGSRYMTLAVSSLFGLYLFVVLSPHAGVRLGIICILAIANVRLFALDHIHQDVLSGFQEMKRRWLAAYSSELSLSEIEKRSGVLLLGATQERFEQLQASGRHLPHKARLEAQP